MAGGRVSCHFKDFLSKFSACDIGVEPELLWWKHYHKSKQIFLQFHCTKTAADQIKYSSVKLTPITTFSVSFVNKTAS